MSDKTPTSLPNDFTSRVHRPQKRTKTSCRPCRERKVKCDGRAPCQSCRKRQYPDLCYYDNIAPPIGRTEIYNHQPPSSLTSLGRWNTPGESHPRYLGNQSIPAFIHSEEQDHGLSATSTSNDVNEGVMPMLGLSGATESPYPFMPVPSLLDPLDTLPNARELLRILQNFRQEVAPFIPNFLDVDKLEIEICEFLEAQDSADRSRLHSSTEIYKNPSNAWLAMLYSILAVGVQVSDMPQSERSRQSTLYSRHSFQSLRNANFLLYPNEACVQSLLMLGIFLQNDASPEAAWMLLGTTVRVAQSIGLHTAASCSTSLVYPQNKSNAIWVAVIWQDTLLSMCFDRPTSVIMEAPPALDVLSFPDQSLSYHESMYYLNFCLNHGRSLRKTHNFDVILELVERIESIKLYMCHEMQDLKSCKNIQQRAHFFAFNLHLSFSIAWICRPALSNTARSSDTRDARHEIAKKCHQNLIEALHAFLKLQPICLFAARSWSFFHNGISSALLLALIDDTKADPEVRAMQECLLRTLPQNESDCMDGVTTSEYGDLALTKAHARALGFLQKLRASQTTRNTSRNGPVSGTTSIDQNPIVLQEVNDSDLHAEVAKYVNTVDTKLINPCPKY
ncbi:hypothetical protein PEBR_07235 [Penicillium brasilianum]|uniref:Zn(2)-C6 fungal-type domain-containing protein n=1 Tax=Penicillium brasilianum TaxID=104259 RepID=A0A1S9RW59_PENBI|nr:hypothetical protein PEBR_07235 [Penicillium brasilianum]